MALLESGQIGNVNEIRYGITILYQAVIDREVAAIEALLRHGADNNLGRPARWELSIYFREVLAADGFAKYDRSRRAPFVAMLDRGLSLPRDAISVVCEFWLRVGEYHPDTNLYIRFC